MSKRIGIAVLGAGRWGTHLIRNFSNHSQTQLLAVLDPSSEHLQALDRQFSLSPQVVLTSDWAALTELAELEAVVIATPASTHYPLVKQALEQGYHVLAEKPLTLTWEESIALCQLAEQQRRQLMIDHTYLFNPAVQQGQSVVQSGQLGELRYGYAARTHLGPVRQDVDALWDLAIHDIAIFNTWLGATPIQVSAQGQTWLQPGLADVVWVTLIYESGFRATIHLCWLNPDKQRRLILVGSQGSLIFDELRTEAPLVVQQGILETQEHRGKTLFTPAKQQQQIVPLPQAEPLRQVCDHFVDCVQTDRASEISSGWIGAELVKILCALQRSLQENGKLIDLV